MLECTLLKQCHFFNKKQVDMPGKIMYLKMKYCTGGGSCACARYVLSRKLGQETIPEHLLPDQWTVVREILGFL